MSTARGIFKCGRLVQMGVGTGGGSSGLLYGVVVAAGRKQFEVLWESDHRTRYRQEFLGLDNFDDAGVPHHRATITRKLFTAGALLTPSQASMLSELDQAGGTIFTSSHRVATARMLRQLGIVTVTDRGPAACRWQVDLLSTELAPRPVSSPMKPHRGIDAILKPGGPLANARTFSDPTSRRYYIEPPHGYVDSGMIDWLRHYGAEKIRVVFRSRPNVGVYLEFS